MKTTWLQFCRRGPAGSTGGSATAGAALFVGLLLLWGCQQPPDKPKPPKPPGPGEPLAGLTPGQRERFAAGRQAFMRVFTPADGLGPLFNANACAECHESPALGGTGDEIEVHATKFIPPDQCDPLFEEGGPVIQQEATPLLQAHGIDREQIPPSATAQAHRATPPLFGLGLVEAIPDEAILRHEDPDDANGDGIRGHANRTIDGRVGRFGRKAAVATLADFNAGAYLDEMGITSPRLPVENTVNGAPLPPGVDPAPDPEIGADTLAQTDDFVRYLAPPPRQFPADEAGRQLAHRGEELFERLSCAVCHVPEMTTGPSPVAALDRRPVALYSDLLLHDMGPDLADICLGRAKPAEFRTELLMGLRLRTHFLHDGSAKTVAEAISRHGGEAQGARDRFNALGDADRSALLKFLETL